MFKEYYRVEAYDDYEGWGMAWDKEEEDTFYPTESWYLANEQYQKLKTTDHPRIRLVAVLAEEKMS